MFSLAPFVDSSDLCGRKGSSGWGQMSRSLTGTSISRIANGSVTWVWVRLKKVLAGCMLFCHYNKYMPEGCSGSDGLTMLGGLGDIFVFVFCKKFENTGCG